MNVSSSEIIENNNSKTLNRVSTKDEWALANPILQSGELGFEIDGQMTNIKMGNGVTHWNALPYISKQCPYDVGDIFYTENETHPSVRWPGTEWEALPGGHCLVAAGTNPNTGTVFHAGETGGEEKHQLTVGELAVHTHTRGTMNIVGVINTFLYDKYASGAFSMGTWDYSGQLATSENHYGGQLVFDASNNWTGATSETGDNSCHNTMSPYLTVYCYKRTA